jgi:hypothetical protein
MSLNAIASPAAFDPWPLVTLVRSLTVAKVDSIGLAVRVGALVVHPRRRHLHRPGAGHHGAGLRGTVAHYHPAAILVPDVSELADVSGDLGLQRRGQHRPRPLPHDPVDQRRRLPLSRQRGRHPRDYCEHGGAFPASVPAPAIA